MVIALLSDPPDLAGCVAFADLRIGIVAGLVAGSGITGLTFWPIGKSTDSHNNTSSSLLLSQ